MQPAKVRFFFFCFMGFFYFLVMCQSMVKMIFVDFVVGDTRYRIYNASTVEDALQKAKTLFKIDFQEAIDVDLKKRVEKGQEIHAISIPKKV